MKDGKVAAKVLINGKRLTQEHQLLHRERVILDEDFAFRFSCPRQAAAQREAAKVAAREPCAAAALRVA